MASHWLFCSRDPAAPLLGQRTSVSSSQAQVMASFLK